MTPSGEDTLNSRPVQKFKPTSGLVVGYTGLVFVCTVVIYVALRVHTVTGLQVALGALIGGLLIWMTQLRSRATVYADRLLLKNSLRDAVIPLVLIEEVSVRQTLNVWVGDQRYMCLGIGSSLRSIFKESRNQGGSTMLGSSRMHEFSEMANRAAPDQSAMSYEAFVVTRIEELVAEAKKAAAARGTTDDLRPTFRYAWPEIVALGVLGAAFVASLTL